MPSSLSPTLTRLLRKAMSGAFLVYGSGALLVLLSQLFLTRLMGASQYGIYYFVLSWMMVLVIPAKLGIDHALLRFVPAYVAKQEWSLLHGILRWGNRTVLIGGISVAGLTALSLLLLENQDPWQRQTFFLACLILPLWALTYLRQSVLRGLKHVALALLPELIAAPILLISIVLIAAQFNVAPQAPMVMGATLLAALLALMLGHHWYRKSLPSPALHSPPQYHQNRWMTSARALFVGSGMHVLMNNTDAIMLGLLTETDVVGIYGIAARCAFIVAFPLTVANAIFAPMISELLHTERQADLQHFLSSGMRWVIAASVSIATMLILFSTPLLGFFGPGFTSGQDALLILVIGQLVNALSGPVAYLVAYAGHEKLTAWVLSGGGLLNILLNALLIPLWGIQGAAIATGVSIIFWNLTLYLVARRIVHIDCSALGQYLKSP